MKKLLISLYFASAISLAVGIPLFLGLSGCSAVNFESRVVTVPQVESAPDLEIIDSTTGERTKRPGGFALAWRVPVTDSTDKQADILIGLEPLYRRGGLLAESSFDAGQIELVRLGDDGRYFIAWPDLVENESGQLVSGLRWAIWSGISGQIEEWGGWPVASGHSVAELAAAYNPELIDQENQEPVAATVLVAVLVRNTTEFGECVMDAREGVCHLFTSRIAVGEDGVAQSNLVSTSSETLFGATRGLSVAAGGNKGFLVAFAAKNYGDARSGNTVRVIRYTPQAAGPDDWISITGNTDCSDDLVVEEEDETNINISDRSFLDTAVAYDSIDEKYLVGYITNCFAKRYFRARTVKYTSEGNWEISGIEGVQVQAPPLQIADSANVSDPMLAYDDDFDSQGGVFLAAYGAEENAIYGPTEEPIVSIPRKMFYAQFIKYDGSILPHEPIKLLKDNTEGALEYPTLDSGDIAADAMYDLFLMAWEQTTRFIPCENYWEPHDSGWVCEADLEGEKVREAEGRYWWIDAVPER